MIHQEQILSYLQGRAHSPLRMGLIKGFICARYTIAHIIQQQTVAVITRVKWNMLVEAPRLQQRSEKRQAMKPARKKMAEVTRNPIGVAGSRGGSPGRSGLERTRRGGRREEVMWGSGRPVLRGAPFVLCSNCLRLVQLPTDFAIPSRGTRRLQCGSCAQVLSYSYRDPNRKKLESPFGGDESSTDDSEIHQVGDDHNTGAHQAEPYSYSYSEEYGISAGVSYSTEDERPLHVSRNSSFNTIDERSGKESKLHRLMGYSSASELMRHSPDLYESFSRRTPNARTYDVKGKGVCMTDGSDAKDGAMKGSKAKERRMGLPFQGMFKKGIHGLESLKLGS